MAHLIHLPHSPWSERARWALDHHRIAYTTSTFLPMLSVPLVRLKLRRLRGRITVPILFDGAAVFEDSHDIALHAEAHGTGTPLFPDGGHAVIEDWHARADAALEAGRSLATRRTAADSEAQLEALPHGSPRQLVPVAALGVRYFVHKYALADRTDALDRQLLRDTLHALRDGLGGRPHLIGDRLSYADILAAMVFQFVTPVADHYIRMGAATRRARANPDLADEFADLVAWRDRLYAEHRR
jgi:glutathione S-transferase